MVRNRSWWPVLQAGQKSRNACSGDDVVDVGLTWSDLGNAVTDMSESSVKHDEGSLKTCCMPARNEGSSVPVVTASVSRRQLPVHAVPIEGGKALVGTNDPQIPDDGEGPLRRVAVQDFIIGATTVTNQEFAEFVAATGYVTEAERFGWSFVFWQDVVAEGGSTLGVEGAEWWRRVDGACWSAPNGPGTEAACRLDHPVVQVSWNDAVAYCKWVGGRLPTEAEWEHAARGGQGDVRFPWGDDEPNDTDFFPCNIWQGHFPNSNTAKDGYAATAPARSFAPNGYGLFNMVGNVWEWTSERYHIRSLKRQVKERLRSSKGFKLSKGGSFLCHRDYCYRYRIAARTGTSPESSTSHHGFRVIWEK